MIEEKWKAVVGFEGIYEVSDLGGVRRISRMHRSGQRVFRHRVMKLCRESNGYLRVTLWRNASVGEKILVHTLVLTAFVGPRPPGAVARHFPDNDRANNAARNLSWGTAKQNQADRIVHGTDNRGERHPLAKIGHSAVQQIKALCEAGIQQRNVAARFGISQRQVGRIARGESWKHTLSTNQIWETTACCV